MNKVVDSIKSNLEEILRMCEIDESSKNSPVIQVENGVATLLDVSLNSGEITDYSIVVKEKIATDKIPEHVSVGVGIQIGEHDKAEFYNIDSYMFPPKDGEISA